MKFHNILVVCTGNICRSPMAEILLKEVFPNKHIFSAGTYGLTGESIDPLAEACLNTINLSGLQHIAQKITADHIRQADLILTMSNRQLRFIEQEWPFSRGKVFRLGHWQHKDIVDPYQQSSAFFMQVFNEIQLCINDWQPRLQDH